MDNAPVVPQLGLLPQLPAVLPKKTMPMRNRIQLAPLVMPANDMDRAGHDVAAQIVSLHAFGDGDADGLLNILGPFGSTFSFTDASQMASMESLTILMV